MATIHESETIYCNGVSCRRHWQLFKKINKPVPMENEELKYELQKLKDSLSAQALAVLVLNNDKLKADIAKSRVNYVTSDILALRVKSLEGEVGSLKRQITSLETQIQAQNVEIAERGALSNSLYEQIDELKEKLK